MENNLNPFSADQQGQVSPILLAPDLTKILAQASLSTYQDYNKNTFPKKISSGNLSFTNIACFTGFDDEIDGFGKEEKYGLIYSLDAMPTTLLIAFRGTASAADAIMDLESILPVEFKPYKIPTGFPPVVHVGDGFYKIYAEKGNAMVRTMRDQLFDFLDSTPHDHLIITGHSLGCPLGSLFALDVAASQPTQITNINFASPRVGTVTWYHAYEQYVTNTQAPNGQRNWTIRIANNYDEVPKLPPQDFPTYFYHVGYQFPVSFTTTEWHFDEPMVIDSWHSLLNYQTVINHAVVNSPQGWSCTFNDAAQSGWEMISYNPFDTRPFPVSERFSLNKKELIKK